MNNIIDTFNLFVGFSSFMVVIALMLTKNKKPFNYIVIALYFSNGIIMTTFSLEVSGKMAAFPHLLGVGWPFQTLTAGLLCIYVQFLSKPQFQLKKKHLLFLLPAFLYCISLIPVIFLKSATEKIYIISHYEAWTNAEPIGFVLFNLVTVVFFSYIIYELRIVLNTRLIKTMMHLRIVIILIILGIIGCILNFVGLIVESVFLLRLCSLFFDALLLIPLILSLRYPNFIVDLKEKIESEKYKQSTLNGINISQVVKQLDTLMTAEKLYTNPDLSMAILSNRLSVSIHQLSEIMNTRLKKNFATYINDHRIEEAKRLLVEEPEAKIIDIAYNAGFNSISAFNTAFKKNTFFSPKEYRKEHMH